jgi:pilus assembly protein CpaB
MHGPQTKGLAWVILGIGSLAVAAVLTVFALRTDSTRHVGSATVLVAVATRPVPAMSPLVPGDAALRPFPAALAPAGIIRSLDVLRGAWTLAPLVAGEPVVAADLVHPGSDPLITALLGSHEQAVGVSLSPTSAAGGFVAPGTRVNLYMASARQSREIAAGIRVLAVNGSLAALPAPPTGASELLTLAVPDAQVPAVLQAQAAGTLVVTLAPGR